VFSDDNFGQRVLRRCMTIGVTLMLLLLCIVTAPIALPVFWGMDRLRSDGTAMLRTFLCIMGIFTLELVGVVLALGLVLLRWLGPLRDSERFQTANYRLQWRWGNWQLRNVMRRYQMSLKTTNTALVRPGPVLVFMRHVSLPDTLLPPAILSLPHGLRLRYVVKDALRNDPCLDIVGNNTPNAFVTRGSDNAGDLAKVRGLCEGIGERDGILIYPEGTRFTPQKRERIITRFREKGDESAARYAESLHNLLPPRFGGPLTLLQCLPSADVVFVGQVGFESAGTLHDLWSGGLLGNTIEVGCWRIARSAVPEDEEGRRAWLKAEWQRMDRWVGERVGQNAATP
jgi:1-acyl-sn-glycerol-3-phosphate acyltransferase